jgi:hypothetical protein
MRPGQKIENFRDTRFPLTLDPLTIMRDIACCRSNHHRGRFDRRRISSILRSPLSVSLSLDRPIRARQQVGRERRIPSSSRATHISVILPVLHRKNTCDVHLIGRPVTSKVPMGVGTDPGEFLRESLGWRLSRLPRLSDELSFGSRGRAEHAYRQSNLSLINPAPAQLNRPDERYNRP